MRRNALSISSVKETYHEDKERNHRGYCRVLVVFAAVATVGAIVQKAQDAGISAMDPGFVPSTGQINNGHSQAAELELFMVSGRPFFHEKQNPESNRQFNGIRVTSNYFGRANNSG